MNTWLNQKKGSPYLYEIKQKAFLKTEATVNGIVNKDPAVIKSAERFMEYLKNLERRQSLEENCNASLKNQNDDQNFSNTQNTTKLTEATF